MRKISCIVSIGIMLLLCACGSNYHYKKTDINEELKSAQNLFDEAEYEDSLALYLEGMKKEPKNVEARIGTVKCQMEMENYNMASINLGLAIEVAPTEITLYDLYAELSERTDNISYAQNAINLAKQYGVEEFLERVPQEPSLSIKGGNYNEKIQVGIESTESDVEIYFSAYKSGKHNYTNVVYEEPWEVTRGETRLTAYCVKDGIPSETVEATYYCDYAPVEIHFEEPLMERLVRNELDKENGVITDVDCEQMTSLYISDYHLGTDDMSYEEYSKLQIKTLNDLQYFPNVNHIYMYNQTEVEDFTPISKCWWLSSIQMEECNISDVNFVSELPNLYSLYLRENNISDISPILKCKNLNNLNISQNPISDVSGVTSLENLTSLGISCEQIEDISILSQLNRLVSLDLYWKERTDLSTIGNMTNLESLSISYDTSGDEYYDERQYLHDISFITSLTNLTYLNISGLEDLSVAECLKDLKNLETLYLYNRNNVNYEEDDAIISALQRALPNCSISY